MRHKIKNNVDAATVLKLGEKSTSYWPLVVIALLSVAAVLLAAFLWYPPLKQASFHIMSNEPFKAVVEDKININTASMLELTLLPGIGKVKAQAIIDYRNENGPFASIDDVINVKGIGPKILEDIADIATI